MNANEYKLWVTIGYFAAAIIVLLFSLLISYLLIRKLFRLYTNSKLIFGDSTETRLISLGIAAIYFYDVVQQIFITVFNAVSQYFIEGSREIINNWQANIELCSEENAYRCIGQLSAGYYHIITSALSKVLDNLTSISIYKLIFLLAGWALIALLINYARQYKTTDSSSASPNIHNWLRFFYSNRHTATAKNIAFTLILIIGGYLSAAAIAAIPGLQEKSAAFQEVSPERLKTQIDEMIALFDKYPTEIASKNPFGKLNEYLAEAKKGEQKKEAGNNQEISSGNENPAPNLAANNSNTNASNLAGNTNSNRQITGSANTNAANANVANANAQPPAGIAVPANTVAEKKTPSPPLDPEIVTYLEAFINDKERTRQMIRARYKELLDNIKSQQKSARTLAVQSYEVGNLDRKGNKERVKYFLDITEWFNRRTTNFDENLNGCLKSVQNLDGGWEAQTDSILNTVRSGGDPFEFISYNSNYFNEALSAAFRSCPYSITNNETFPTRPQLGESSYLGPFGFVASWLLRTESLPLALITGLLGFGLLGSACSTFIRERISYKGKDRIQPVVVVRTENDNRQLVHDLTGVVIRGLSAAIVVFLAVVGGLAIFSSGSNEPNPYVLLLTCLIAAVFSETVWEWAQKELNRKFNGKDESSKEKEAAKKTAGEAAAKKSPEKVKRKRGISSRRKKQR